MALSSGSLGFYILCNVSETIPENKISLPDLVYSSDSVVFPVALQDSIWYSWISTLVIFLHVREKHIVESCHPWDQSQPVSSMVPITALHRKIPLFFTQSNPFTKLPFALSLDAKDNDVLYFLKFICIQFENIAVLKIWKVFFFFLLCVYVAARKISGQIDSQHSI